MTLAERLASTAVEDRLAAIAALGETPTPPTDAELDALADCLGHARKVVQRRAAETFAALAARGVAVGAVLDRALGAAELRARWGAAYALALAGDPPPAVVPVLIEALGVDDGDVRWAAADVLRGLPTRAALVPRLCTLVTVGNPAQRKMALYCLRDLDARTAAVEVAVTGGLADPEPNVRLAAMASLARLALDRAGAAVRLTGALAGETETLRRAAAAALGALGVRDAAVVAALRAAAASPDAALRRAATRALAQLGDG